MGNIIPDWPRKRGDIVLISSMANVPRETVRRIVSGQVNNTRFEAVQAVSAAVATLVKQRKKKISSEKADETKTENSKQADETKTKSRKSADKAVEAGA